MESNDGDKAIATDAAESMLALDCDEDALPEKETIGARREPNLANGGGNEATTSSSSAGNKRKRFSLSSNQEELNGPGVSSSSSVAKRTSVFDDPTTEIQELTSDVKKNIIALNSAVVDLQVLCNSQNQSSTVVDNLKTHMMSAKNEFKEVLMMHTEVRKKRRQMSSSSASKESNPFIRQCPLVSRDPSESSVPPAPWTSESASTPLLQRKTPEDMRFRYVYSRKRLCRKRNCSINISEKDSCPKIVSCSAMVLPALPGRVSDTRADASLTYVSLLLNLPLKPVFKFICESCSIWLSNTSFLLQFGTLVAIWPVVHLDILFVDNILGLKHLLLDTCLRSAVSFFCFLVGSFNQCSRQSSLKDLEMPCTSIRFHISSVHGKSQVVLMMYSFVAMGGSKWKHLLGKLQDHFSTRGLSNCDSKYKNIMHHTNGTSRRVVPSTNIFTKGLDLCGTQLLGVSNCSDISPVICYFSALYECTQNDLDMATAPSLLFRRHLNLLTEGNLTNGSQQSISFTYENDTPVSNLVQELNEDPIGRSTPTAPRTTYHRNRFTSLSRAFGDGMKVLPEELTLTGFTDGSKRPRSQILYSVSPRSEEFALKHKSHFRKIQSHSTAKINGSKRFTDNSRSGHSSPESLTCVANVLVTVGDRGWREYDTQITMDSEGQSERRICVTLAEGTKYAHKVCQVLQPGATNRYTHAMIWKGGAEWCLEFPDRSQWSIFKQMHYECYSHNIRAASVKNIPIPGVCLVEDDDNVALSFVRSQDYLDHVGTDAEIALDDSRVIYDMDSDDESWISSWRKSLGENISEHKLTEDLFERVMDKLEKFAYSHNCTELTIDQMKELNIDYVSLDIIKGIHAYWKDKRQKKGMPLIRHFQSAMWKIYEQQLHDWESTVYRMQGSNGYQEKNLPPKPALFAFCLRPRGLQIPNKGPKQRSHKKLMSSMCHSFSREQEGFYRAGRRYNEYVGDGRTYELYDSGSVYSPTGYSPRFSLRTDSPRSSDASERSSTPRYFRTNSSKRGASFAFFEDHQPSPSFRHQKAKRGAPDHWNNAIQEWQNTKHLFPGASQSHRVDIEELKVRDVTGAAQHLVTIAKLKREKAHCLMHKADLALHKATAALMMADVIKSSCDGRRDFRDDER